MNKIRLTALLIAPFAAFAGNPETPPVAVASQYQTGINWQVSSDFSSIDFDKWTYRRSTGAQGDASNTAVENGALVVRGAEGETSGGGLATRNECKYGFYVVRWKTTGLAGKATVWHPAIWSTHTNMGGKSDRRDLADKTATIDINWMELWTKNGGNTWSGTCIDKRNGSRTAICKDDLWNAYGLSGDWNQWGLEYTPSYVARWEYKNNDWVLIKKTMFSDAPTSAANLNSAIRSPMYWIFSNKYHLPTLEQSPVDLYIDYFYHYPLL